MKPLHAWLLALGAISMVACDSTDDPVDAGTEVGGMNNGGTTGGMPGGMPGGEMPGGEMPGGEMPGGEMPGGVMTAGVDTPGGVMTGPGCTEPLDVGASCDVFNDCCARGTECSDLSGDGSNTVCLRRCDANADVTGCEARELCNPENGDVPPGEESPGTCIPGDDCEPGNESLSCGEGEYSCQRVQNITLCIGDLAEVRAQAPELIVGAGEACNPFDQMAPAYCEPGTVCEYGFCRALCDTAADCDEGSECADYSSRVDGIPFKFCLDSCSIYEQNCPNEGDVCILADTNDGALVGICEGNAGANGTAVAGEACMSAENNYWGTCTASNLCTSFEEGGEEECVSFCDDYNLDVCSGDYQACAFVMALDDLGICLGECNIFTQEGCEENQDCVFFNEGVNTEDEPVALGRCANNTVPAANRVNTGDECVGEPIEVDGIMSENPLVSNCPANHICGQEVMNGPSICIAICDPTAAESGCQDGRACRAVPDLTTLGLCR
jgi:hypothetical protein